MSATCDRQSPEAHRTARASRAVDSDHAQSFSKPPLLHFDARLGAGKSCKSNGLEVTPPQVTFEATVINIL